MLVTVAILIILTGLGIAGFINFNERQQVANTAKQIQHILRTGQSKARVKEMPADCTFLLSYEVYRNSSGPINLRANCQNGNKPPEVWTIPTGIAVAPATFSVKFKTLFGGANITGETSLGTLGIDVSRSGTQYIFEVTTGGEITQGDFAP